MPLVQDVYGGQQSHPLFQQHQEHLARLALAVEHDSSSEDDNNDCDCERNEFSYFKRREKIVSAFSDKFEDEEHEISDIIYKSYQYSPMLQSDLAQSHQRELDDYKDLVCCTRDISLNKVVLTPAGCSLFDELCLRLDVNQRYAEALPQWRDVAEHLEIDALRTQWVQTCVRPKDGLTRAMLEIYMKDGGTLGEVLEALLDLKCYQILESLKTKVEQFIKERENKIFLHTGQAHNGSNYATGPQFFSILSTLATVLGQDDPCMILQKFANGLKAPTTAASSDARTHELIVQNATIEVGNNSAPSAIMESYRSDRHLRPDEKAFKLNQGRKNVCKIMLLFSADGLQFADELYELVQDMDNEGMRAEVFRLNESSLWYECLVQAEACCMKWANEVDYVMPVITPQLVDQFQDRKGASSPSDDESFLPTCPKINRYMWTLLRARYMDSSCKNTMVRPVIPPSESKMGQDPRVTRDPLLRNVWIPLKKERVHARMNAMLAETAKRSDKYLN